ncbi:unnamed protein product [Alopecurus aequalis]
MAPRRRPEGAPPPDYGHDSRYFSVEIHHGSYFLGIGPNRSYVSGSVIWNDHLDSENLSAAVLGDMIEEIGYEMQGRIKVHFCTPLLAINRNGLRPLITEDAIVTLLKFVSIGYPCISLYLDHDESMNAIDRDDVVHNPVAQLPPVISPVKPVHVQLEEEPVHVPIQVIYPDDGGPVCTRGGLRNRGKKPIEITDGDDEQGQETNVSDGDKDPDYTDSDYDITGGDDDLYVDNVDVEGEMHRKKGKEAVQMDVQKGKEEVKQEDECASEHYDLWAADSDDEQFNKFRFKTFRDEDLKNPIFHVGQVFESVLMLRKAIKEYSCRNRWGIKLPVNDKQRLCAKCDDCTWYLWASLDRRTQSWMIKKYNGNHSCTMKWNVMLSQQIS